jgi:hypothetical protein
MHARLNQQAAKRREPQHRIAPTAALLSEDVSVNASAHIARKLISTLFQFQFGCETELYSNVRLHPLLFSSQEALWRCALLHPSGLCTRTSVRWIGWRCVALRCALRFQCQFAFWAFRPDWAKEHMHPAHAHTAAQWQR